MPGINIVTHVIFDLDGILLDTEPLYTQANSQTLAKYGKKFTWELKQKMMGRTHEDAIKVLLQATGLENTINVDEYTNDYDGTLNLLLPAAKILPGVQQLVTHLHAHKVPMAVCTGSSENGYHLKSASHPALFSLFHHYVAISTDPAVKHGKPAPDCFLECASRFAHPTPTPDKVLVFEDATNGVQAALAAEMHVIMVPDERVADSVRQKATICVDSLDQFSHLARFGLPPF